MPGPEEALVAGIEEKAAAARAEGVWCLVRGRGLRLGALSPDLPLIEIGESDAGLHHRAEELTVEAGAGLTLARMNAMLAPSRQWFPAGLPGGDQDSLGGAVGAGLAGFWSGYGSIRDRVLGMRVYTPAFGVVSLGASVVKSVAGYNMPRVYWGSEGTFGVVLSVTLKLAPLPRIPLRHRSRRLGPGEWRGLTESVESLLDQGWPESSAWVEAGPDGVALHAVAPEDLVEDAPFDAWADEELDDAIFRGAGGERAAIPRKVLSDLLDQGRADQVFVADLRTGSAYVTAGGGLSYSLSGTEAMARRPSVRGGPLTVAPDVFPAWARFKQAVDPDGVLRPLALAAGSWEGGADERI